MARTEILAEAAIFVKLVFSATCLLRDRLANGIP